VYTVGFDFYRVGIDTENASGLEGWKDAFSIHVKEHFDGTTQFNESASVISEWRYLPPIESDDFKTKFDAWMDWVFTQQTAKLHFRGTMDAYDF
jgi:hypothetical protein